ncbi:MAG: hypothetical protein HY328_07215 [Chloroflexi bacterium]|nr:hypothetical protein [Chloroflexota bacterium]
MNVIGAIVAGLAGTIVMSMLMAVAPMMGMPKMDIVGILGSMFSKQGNTMIGWVMHLIMGIIFGLIYALLWNSGIGTATLVGGLIFGVVHWLVVGLMMGGVPMMHAGVKAGTVKAPGIYMMNNGGMMAFVGGLVGHAVFGLVVGLVYGLLA